MSPGRDVRIDRAARLPEKAKPTQPAGLGGGGSHGPEADHPLTIDAMCPAVPPLHPPPTPEAPSRGANDFLADVLNGLGGSPKTLPCKYFYDARGSRLFDRICALEEYYPTRVETALLTEHADRIAAAAGPRATLVEFGGGSCAKVGILLDALECPRAYVPIDISYDHMAAAAARLAAAYPALEVRPVPADYTRLADLPPDLRGTGCTGFFPGSTIGNFTPRDAQAFLGDMRLWLGANGRFLVGVDLKKPAPVLHAAYNDAAGITAAFNLNLLRRVNRETGADFILDNFEHEARYNEIEGRIEMHLISREAQRITVAGRVFRFTAGETIHTENSYKYTVGEFHALAARAGWSVEAWWTDRDELFSVHLLIAP